MTDDRFGSPQWLTDALQAHFGKFDLDWCAEPWSAVVPRFITEQQDVFKVRPTAEHGYGNHPYSRGSLHRFVAFARESVLEGRIAEMTQLVPHYTAEGWWQMVEKPEGRVLGAEWRYGQIAHPRLANWRRLLTERLTIDVIAVSQRLEHRFPPRYTGARETARYSSAVVRFSKPQASLRDHMRIT